MWRRIKIASWCAAGVAASVFLLASALHGQAVAEVEVALKQGAAEPEDNYLIGFSEYSRLPDYRLQLRAGGVWYDLGTIVNRSARQPLRYRAEYAIPVARLTALRLSEADKLSNTVLERHAITGLEVAGRSYRYRIATEYRFAAGLKWTMATVYGQAVLVFAIVFGFVGFLGGVGRMVPE